MLSDPTVDFIGTIRGMQTVRGSLDLDADAGLVYDLLTDYDSCSRIFRNVASSTVQYSEGRKQVLQVGKEDASRVVLYLETAVASYVS